VFTGLVEEVGVVTAVEPAEAGARLSFRAPQIADGLQIGDSVAVDGACLTAVAIDGDVFSIDAVAETLRRTCLGQRATGDPVNLERAMPVDGRLGGHLVQGHIDGTGVVSAARREGESVMFDVTAGPEIMRYVVEKGSITVDGVSLTVAARADDHFSIALIPHTMAMTTLGEDAVGRVVNLEADLVAKYVEAFVAPYVKREGER
jgi:riboflavin synthase